MIHIDPTPGTQLFVLDTETPAKRASEFRSVLVFSGVVPILFNGLYYLLVAPNWENIGILATCDSGFLVGGIVVLSGAWRGTWVINEERVVFQPLRGQPKSIEWSDVGLVHWSHFPTLVGRGVRIRLSCVRFSRSEWGEARAFVESKLSGSFDLEPVEPINPGAPVRLELTDPFIGAMSRLFALVAMATIALLLAIMFVPGRAERTLLRVLTPLLLLLVAFFAYFLGLFRYAAEQRCEPWKRRLRRIHPAWPWRLRREVASSRAKKQLDDPVLDDWSP
jgi:hypothetical protein